ncbi:MAG: HAMP domain-containing sensor histidine kinase [Myxococcaceae bacterium]
MDLRHFYRWGWLPLIAGCAVIAVTVILLSEALIDLTGVAPGDARLRVVFMIRSVITSVLLALWVGWYVLKSRQRIERVREQLRSQQAALAEQAWRVEQMVGLGALTRVLAHEIRGPLHSIALQTTALRRRVAKGQHQEEAALLDVAGQVEADVERLDGLLEDYMDYTHVPSTPLVPQPVDFRAMIRSVLDPNVAGFRRKGVTVMLDLAEDLPGLSADPARLRQLVQLLVRNALESASQGGAVRISLRRDEGGVRFDIAHDGPPVERPEAVFRPFFSARRGSSGLALAIVRDIVRAHGGEVSAHGPAGGGLEITARLPGAQG